MLFPLVALALLTWVAQAAVLPVANGDSFDLAGLVDAPLSPVALYLACKAHPVCSDMYGLATGVTVADGVNALLQDPVYPLPLQEFAAAIDVLDGKTIEEVAIQLHVDKATIRGQERNPCGFGEEYILLTKTCRPRIDSTPNSCASSDAVIITLLAIIALFAALKGAGVLLQGVRWGRKLR